MRINQSEKERNTRYKHLKNTLNLKLFHIRNPASAKEFLSISHHNFLFQSSLEQMTITNISIKHTRE